MTGTYTMIKVAKKPAKQHNKRNTVQKLFGFCPACGRWFNRIETYRQHTNYVDDELNFFTGCKLCSEENDLYWEAMWDAAR